PEHEQQVLVDGRGQTVTRRNVERGVEVEARHLRAERRVEWRDRERHGVSRAGASRRGSSASKVRRKTWGYPSTHVDGSSQRPSGGGNSSGSSLSYGPRLKKMYSTPSGP